MFRFWVSMMLMCLVGLVSAGCADNSRPKDLPQLFPCTIKITQNNVPLAGATVEFVPTNQADAKYRALAITDDSGTVQMSTYGYPGVPSGKYKVVTTKNIDDDFVYAANESTGGRDVVDYKTYRMVEPKFSSAETTPHEIEILNKGKRVNAAFDVGKAIKVRM
jgi:hypothetical protein